MSLEEDIINKIIESTNADKALAITALNLADRNIETAINLLNNKVLIITGKAIVGFDNLYCVFLIRIFQHNNFISPLFVFSRDDEIINTDINVDFFSLEKLIREKFFFSDTSLQNLCNDFLNEFTQKSPFSEFVSCPDNKCFTENSQEALLKSIRKSLHTSLDTAALHVESKITILTKAEYETALKNRNYSDVEFTAQDIDNEDSEISGDISSVEQDDNIEERSSEKQSESSNKDHFIKCEFAIAKSSREDTKKIGELAIGDSVYIIPIITTPQLNYIFNIITLDASRFYEKKFKCKVTNIDKTDKETKTVVLEIIPGVYSKIKAENNTLVIVNEHLTSFSFSSIIYLFVLVGMVIVISFIFIFYLKNK